MSENEIKSELRKKKDNFLYLGSEFNLSKSGIADFVAVSASKDKNPEVFIVECKSVTSADSWKNVLGQALCYWTTAVLDNNLPVGKKLIDKFAKRNIDNLSKDEKNIISKHMEHAIKTEAISCVIVIDIAQEETKYTEVLIKTINHLKANHKVPIELVRLENGRFKTIAGQESFSNALLEIIS